MTASLQARARSRAAITPDPKAAALLNECATEINRLRAFEAAHRGRCAPCDGTGRRFPYALTATLAYGQKCGVCGGSGRA